MSTVHEIIKAFGNQPAMADATGIPQQTISQWVNREPHEIPPWRRPAIIAAAHARNIQLPQDALAYLASASRTPREKIAQC